MKQVLEKLVTKKEKTEAEKQRDERQLKRLQILLDVLFALSLIHI